MNHEKVTISDIAKAAGVSITTVSRYINGKQDLIQKDTRERIETVIKMTNYHPNVMAQSLKTNLSHHIGVIVSDILPAFHQIVPGYPGGSNPPARDCSCCSDPRHQ